MLPEPATANPPNSPPTSPCQPTKNLNLGYLNLQYLTYYCRYSTEYCTSTMRARTAVRLYLASGNIRGLPSRPAMGRRARYCSAANRLRPVRGRKVQSVLQSQWVSATISLACWCIQGRQSSSKHLFFCEHGCSRDRPQAAG